MKHMVRNDELLKKIGLTETYPNIIIYSCEFDDGTKAQNVEPIRLGADGMEIWFFPCFSCQQQMQSYSWEPLLYAFKKHHKDDDDRTIVYRGVILVPYSGYEVPALDSDEWKAIERQIDTYLDEGKPMGFSGFRVSLSGK